MGDCNWWKDCVMYKINVRSFQDSDGNGIGDIPGIEERLPYVKDLGIGCICLSSIFTSPDKDYGRDVSDFCSVNPVYGTTKDMENLIQKTHAMGMRIMLDMPVNQTSDQHKWFQESRKGGKENPYADFYIWTDTTCNWKTRYSESVFSWDETRKAYYVHSFLSDQPDINWRCTRAVEAIYDQCRFWLGKGIDGLNLFMVNCIIKDSSLRDNPPLRQFGMNQPYERQMHIFDRNRPECHKQIKYLRGMMEKYPDRLLCGSILQERGGEPELSASYLNGQLDMSFDYSVARAPFTANGWKKCAERWYRAIGETNWPSWLLNGDELERNIDRYGGDERKARLAAMFLMTQKGTPFLYYGEEIAMPGLRLEKEEEKDPVSAMRYNHGQGRDPQRGPMAWSLEASHAFSTGVPWLPYAQVGKEHTVEGELSDEHSLLALYRRLVKLHHDDDVFLNGSVKFLDLLPRHVLRYTRTSNQGERLVILNFSSKNELVPLEKEFSHGAILLDTSSGAKIEDGRLALGPYQGVILII